MIYIIILLVTLVFIIKKSRPKTANDLRVGDICYFVGPKNEVIERKITKIFFSQNTEAISIEYSGGFRSTILCRDCTSYYYDSKWKVYFDHDFI